MIFHTTLGALMLDPLTGLALSLGSAALVWAIRQEGRINGHDMRFDSTQRVLTERDKLLDERDRAINRKLDTVDTKMDQLTTIILRSNGH